MAVKWPWPELDIGQPHRPLLSMGVVIRFSKSLKIILRSFLRSIIYFFSDLNPLRLVFRSVTA